MPAQDGFLGSTSRPLLVPVLLGTRKNITQIAGERQARTALSAVSCATLILLTPKLQVSALICGGYRPDRGGMRRPRSPQPFSERPQM